MTEKQIIDSFIASADTNRAIEALTSNITDDPTNALWPYMRGRLYWQIGNRRAAITDYETAVAIDPASPASTALDLARSVMSFYNKDMLNP